MPTRELRTAALLTSQVVEKNAFLIRFSEVGRPPRRTGGVRRRAAHRWKSNIQHTWVSFQSNLRHWPDGCQQSMRL